MQMASSPRLLQNEPVGLFSWLCDMSEPGTLASVPPPPPPRLTVSNFTNLSHIH